jgi:hypothetical protein
MAWKGKRYEVRIAGFGVIGRDIANAMLFGAYSSLVRPVGYELPMSPFDPPTDERELRLVILLSASETLGQMLPACRQLKAQSDDNYILAILIGDIDEANPAQCEAHKALRQSANITLCLPYEQETCGWQRGWKQDPVIQALRALIPPSVWDEYVDFDFDDLREAFSETYGYATVVETGFEVGDEDATTELEKFVRENDLETRCRDAAVFLSIRGVQAMKLDRDLGLSQRLGSMMDHPERLILSVVKDYGDYAGNSVFVTVITVGRNQNAEPEQHSRALPTSRDGQSSVVLGDLPLFLKSVSATNAATGRQRTSNTRQDARLLAQLDTHSDDAERWILGALLVDPNIWALVNGWTPRTSVDESCFYHERNRFIFRAIKALITHHEVVSRDNVIAWLIQREDVDVTSLAEYLEQLERSLVSFYGFAPAVSRYAYILRERWLLRQKATEELQRDAASLSGGSDLASLSRS